jgi:diguanylate cyclase (GGDEF)-like protein
MPHHASQETAERGTTVSRGQSGTGEVVMQRRNGTTVPTLTTNTPIHDPAGQMVGIISVSVDISARKEIEQQLRYLTLHDALTGLPNRLVFADRLAQALAYAKRRGHLVAVLFLDLDRFKLVNDTLGHTVGDVLLVQVAQRLQSCVRGEDTLVRFSGDEFVVLLQQVRRMSDTTRTAERLLASLVAPFVLDDVEVRVNATIGIALSTGMTEHPDQLLRDADSAMYQAKAAGRGRYTVFDAATTPTAAHVTLKGGLRQVLAQERAPSGVTAA